MLEEVHEGVERLARNCDRLAAASQRSSRGLDAVFTEFVCARNWVKAAHEGFAQRGPVIFTKFHRFGNAISSVGW